MSKPFWILALDGGGSKGIFSIGVLEELENMLGQPLHSRFDLIYGTSVGSIATSLVALGKPTHEIARTYLDVIPQIMGKRFASSRTAAVRAMAAKQFEGKVFDDFLTRVGIVAMNYETRTPMIFKNTMSQAHGLPATFKPGFGVSISEAVTASCAAVPYFKKVKLQTQNQGTPTLIDGGFVANNPTLFALADALGPLKVERTDLRVISVGVGKYVEHPGIIQKVLEKLLPVEAVFAANSNTLEIIRRLLFKDIRVVRIDGEFSDLQYQTSLLESDAGLLSKIKNLGRRAFAEKEADVRDMLET